jgi:MFS family permease
MKSYLNTYINNFRGFSREVWVLTLVTYINRAGAMVMPFMTKYLHDSFSFSLKEIGWILACIGCGSLFGSWLGGKFTDKIGFYTVMLVSLFLTGFGIIAILFLYDFVEICIGLFVITTFADMYKPAMYVAVSNFTTNENRTRALSLIRLAVNLGIVSGPILAGMLIRKNDYDYLFWIDGITCVIAISAFMLLIDERKFYKARKKIQRKNKVLTVNKETIAVDKNFVIFLLGSFLTAFLFFQLFTTIPLYNTQKLRLNQLEIGLLLSLNGLIIFILEMPLIGYLERKLFESTKIILLGSVFMASGFCCLAMSNSIVVLVLSIVLITIGQILSFSFSNTFAFSRAIKGQEGKYMALYAMSFSAAQIISPSVGLTVCNYSYLSNWCLMSAIGLIGITLYYQLDKNIKFEAVTNDLNKLAVTT